jgi:ABC-type transporter Mla MlaB component
VANDELFDLDFTLPGAMPPAPPPAPETPPAAAPAKLELSLVDVDAPSPSAAANPAPKPVEFAAPAGPVRPVFPPALSEAADLFAGGDALGASRRLETALKTGEKLGEHAQRVWLALGDVLQALNRRDAFDKIALAYATRFETSPPAWNDGLHAERAAAAERHGGFALPAHLDAHAGDALRELMKVASSSPQIDIDASACLTVDDAGCTLLLRVFDALRKAGRTYRLAQAETLLALLRGQVEVGMRSHEPMWLLLLDILQCVGTQATFEDEAVNYAVSFEVSPPSWNPQLQADDVTPAPARGQVPRPLLAGEVSGLDVARIEAEVGAGDGVASGQTAELDASQLIRLDKSSLEALKAALASAGRRISLRGLPQLPWVSLVKLDVDLVADLQLRKY